MPAGIDWLSGLPPAMMAAGMTAFLTKSAITDRARTAGKLDSGTALVISASTFMIATIGINIVANFVSPASDFCSVAPQPISWHTGGMMAAVRAFIGPLLLQRGYNRKAIAAQIPGLCVTIPVLHGAANCAWFIGIRAWLMCCPFL